MYWRRIERSVRVVALVPGLVELLDAPRRTSWRLSEMVKRDIARRYRQGERLAAIAADYGVRHQIVSYHAHKRGARRRVRRGQYQESDNGVVVDGL